MSTLTLCVPLALAKGEGGRERNWGITPKPPPEGHSPLWTPPFDEYY